MSARVRRTLPGTLAPGDGYAASLFGDETNRPAPQAMFAAEVGTVDVLEQRRQTCPACGGAPDACTCHRTGAAPLALIDDEDDASPCPSPDAPLGRHGWTLTLDRHECAWCAQPAPDACPICHRPRTRTNGRVHAHRCHTTKESTR